MSACPSVSSGIFAAIAPALVTARAGYDHCASTCRAFRLLARWVCAEGEGGTQGSSASSFINTSVKVRRVQRTFQQSSLGKRGHVGRVYVVPHLHTARVPMYITIPRQTREDRQVNVQVDI